MRKATVSIVGNGTLPPESPLQSLARDLGRAIIDEQWRLVCGGRGGVMAAAAAGAQSSEQHRADSVVGVLPTDDPDDANPDIDVIVPTPLGDLRNSIVACSDAVVAIGGGAGTLSEICFAWMLDRPVIAFRVEGWSGRVADQPLDDRRRPVDFGRPDEVFGVDSVTEAIDLLREVLNASGPTD